MTIFSTFSGVLSCSLLKTPFGFSSRKESHEKRRTDKEQHVNIYCIVFIILSIKKLRSHQKLLKKELDKTNWEFPDLHR